MFHSMTSSWQTTFTNNTSKLKLIQWKLSHTVLPQGHIIITHMGSYKESIKDILEKNYPVMMWLDPMIIFLYKIFRCPYIYINNNAWLGLLLLKHYPQELLQTKGNQVQSHILIQLGSYSRDFSRGRERPDWYSATSYQTFVRVNERSVTVTKKVGLVT